MKRLVAIILFLTLFASVSANADGAIEENNHLTIENCEELAAVLRLTNEFDPSISEFSEKYAGRIIEFDGNIAYMTNHGDSKTRYDMLIHAGDYSETSISGPNFQFKDVGIIDLGLSGLWLPGFVTNGVNIRVIAKVGKFGPAYNESTGLFELDPILIEERQPLVVR